MEKSLLLEKSLLVQHPRATATLGTFTAGSKNITDRFTLDTGQRDNFYDIARIVRKAGKPTPIGKLVALLQIILNMVLVISLQ